MRLALDYYSTKSHDIVVQVWFPTTILGSSVLRCSEKHVHGPSIVDDQFMMAVSKRYTYDSLTKVFPIDDMSAKSLGLITDKLSPHYSTLEMATCVVNRWVPVSAFRLRRLQWAPNLHIYKSSCHEYDLKANQGQHYTICGTLALPVFECSIHDSCVGVFEVIILGFSEIDYAVEVHEICKLLEAVNLRAETQLLNEPRQIVLAEILKALREVCHAHNLPLAQTWLPCMCGDQNCQTQKICMSNAEIPFYMMDSTLFAFWEAGSVYHMHRGQGVAGRAFSSKASCFCKDITQFPEDDFCLVRSSREFQMHGSLAICLSSSHTGTDIYIVQFFLPTTLMDMEEEYHFVLDSITATMTQNFASLSLVSYDIEEIDARSGMTIRRKELDPFLFNELEFILSSEGLYIEQDQGDNANAAMISPEEDLVDMNLTKTRKKKFNLSSKEALLPYLKDTLKVAAAKMGVSESTLKRTCRSLGIENWNKAQNDVGVPPVKRKRARKAELVEQVGPSSQNDF